MADVKSKGIPQWQKQDAPKPEDPIVTSTPSQNPSSASSDAESRATLISQATEFLQHDDIRDATTDRKIAFLESKGLTGAEIQQLLGISRNIEASSAGPSEPPSPTPTASFDSPERASTVSATPSNSSGPSEPTITAPSPESAPQPPPIITYPEFLLHASRPAPLVTRTRLLTAIYSLALIASSAHITSTYLLQPMLTSLSAARQSLLSTTGERLNGLNEKLENVVSVIPPKPAVGRKSMASGKKGEKQEDEEEEDEDEDDAPSSIVSDPSELFHRDAGVQTSPPPSSHSSSTSSTIPPHNPLLSPANPTLHHSTLLSSLSSSLSSLTASSDVSLSTIRDTGSAVAELQGYLEDLQFGRGTLGRWDARLGTWVGGGWAGGGKNAGEDELGRVRAEVRGVKGVLLSARSFPMGRG